ncbi:FecR family protein [Ancylobacter rudongensis]|uniref:FecR family protein n=1 Tax=Ancylobacter rudongensis TaxID=177413 RepID=A0A1G4RRC2_9HYPH|nr:FecR domain-containing protein [Ancylobacter rudongensis]SCW59380.1 FecR family protein [Ancylobacter rudongensis]
MTPPIHRPAHPPRALSDEALAFIVRLNSGEAQPATLAAFTAWRRLSPDHEAAAREAEQLWGDASELHQDSRSGLIRPGAGRHSGLSRRALLGGAAGLGIAGTGGAWLAGRLGPRADFATGTGEVRTVTLTDHSRVTLNARSAIALDLTAAHRHVRLLEGQAFFQVAADPARAFEVTAGTARLRALGTAFDVDANRGDGSLAVSVIEHAVRVTGASELTLQAGERVRIGPDGRLGPVTLQPADVTLAWRSGLYIAEDRPLADIIAALRPYHAGWIVTRGEGIDALRVNAVLDLRTPEASLAALAQGLPIRVIALSPFLTIVAAG